MSNHQAFYFDMTYAQVPLTNTYNYTPEKYGMNSENMSNVLGYEGEIWTEWIADNAKLELYAFPRMQALGEVSWSSKEKSILTILKQDSTHISLFLKVSA